MGKTRKDLGSTYWLTRSISAQVLKVCFCRQPGCQKYCTYPRAEGTILMFYQRLRLVVVELQPAPEQ